MPHETQNNGFQTLAKLGQGQRLRGKGRGFVRDQSLFLALTLTPCVRGPLNISEFRFPQVWMVLDHNVVVVRELRTCG